MNFDVPPLCLDSYSDGSIIAVGFVNGSIKLIDTNSSGDECLWEFKTRASVRGVQVCERNNEVYAIIKNRALCVFDINTGQRKRCILKCHSDIPSAISVLPLTALKNQQLATADESGEVKTWDFRSDVPVVRSWKEQEEEINDLKVDKKCNLLAASSDGTLAAFDLRKAKFRVKSETMHSELLSICPTDKFVYVGASDGYIEVFNHSEYGNLLERIESGFDMGVTGIMELRRGLLLTTSSGSNQLKVLNVMPNKRLGNIGTHGDEKEMDGIDFTNLSVDRNILYSGISLNGSVKKWNLKQIVDKIPILRATEAKMKKPVSQGFFDDLMDKNEHPPVKKQKKNEYSDESSEEEDEDEEELSDEAVDDEEEEKDVDEEEELE